MGCELIPAAPRWQGRQARVTPQRGSASRHHHRVTHFETLEVLTPRIWLSFGWLLVSFWSGFWLSHSTVLVVRSQPPGDEEAVIA